MTRIVLSSLIATAAAVALLLSLPEPAVAKQCKSAPTFAEARHVQKNVSRKRAKNRWRNKVKNRYGQSWASWNIAASRAVNCNRAGNKYRCVARAHPCLP
jgi:hypothetical protein